MDSLKIFFPFVINPKNLPFFVIIKILPSPLFPINKNYFFVNIFNLTTDNKNIYNFYTITN